MFRRDRRLTYARRMHLTLRLDLLGLARCGECLCPRYRHEHPERRVPGHCLDCVNCAHYRPRSAW